MENVVRPFEEKVKTLEAEIERLRLLTLRTPEGPKRDKAVEAHESAKKKRVEVLKNAPAYPKAYAVAEGTVVNANIHNQGDPLEPGDEVQRGFLGAFGGEVVPSSAGESGRAHLANWLTSPRIRPLTARVIVNRIWQHHFGQGIVGTPNDFGVRGQRPTHPELLDFLAQELIESNWSIKTLHRQIMLSRTYRQVSDNNVALQSLRRFNQIDPDNEWLWRFNRRRLSAEELRDAMLLLSGQLDLAQGSGHAFPPEHEWKFGQHTPYMGELKSRHRSVYLMRQRLKRDPFRAIFDGADPNVTTGQRSETTTTLQALWLMNNAEFHEYAAAFAARLLNSVSDDSERIRRAYAMSLGRAPDDMELAMAVRYLREYEHERPKTSSRKDVRRHAWASYLRTLISSNEFLYVD